MDSNLRDVEPVVSETVSGSAPLPTPASSSEPGAPAALPCPAEPTAQAPTPTEPASLEEPEEPAATSLMPAEQAETVSGGSSESQAVSEAVSVPTPSARTPSLAGRLIYQVDASPDVATVEAKLALLSEAYHRGDNRAISDALIDQVHMLQTFGTKLLIVAANQKHDKSMEMYSALGLRALEQARKALLALHGLRDTKARRQTNVQVNVGAPANEVLEVSHAE